ncbi:MAG TPA: hypothetical protein VKU19_31350 [Bryobacteraceae bacterium]|nr:hypothetical protein [Bryobacteraceae bacterium]
MKWIAGALLVIAGVPGLFAADDNYTHLWLYNGHWKGTKKVGEAAPVAVDLVNECGRIGVFFGCQQTVDGKIGALVIYAPGEGAGHFYSQAIMPDGKAAGRGELTIDGDHWTYQSKYVDGDRTTWYKTTNVFTGKDHIRFEQAESSDGEHWVVKMSGEETRLK